MLVHGSVAGAASTWATQRPLAERFELLAVERPGFPPGPPVERHRENLASPRYVRHRRLGQNGRHQDIAIAGNLDDGDVGLLLVLDLPQLQFLGGSVAFESPDGRFLAVPYELGHATPAEANLLLAVKQSLSPPLNVGTRVRIQAYS